jgi:hypothetical protein
MEASHSGLPSALTINVLSNVEIHETTWTNLSSIEDLKIREKYDKVRVWETKQLIIGACN